MEAGARPAGRITTIRLPVAPVAAGLGAVFAAALAAFFGLRAGPASIPATSAGPRLAYVEFGFTADTLWAAPAGGPEKRRRVFVTPHAPGFGIVAALSPDRASVAFTSLPPDTRAPGPDTPADLYTASLGRSARPRLVAGGFDLLVRPLWTPSGEEAVLRRGSGAGTGGFALVEVSLRDGGERVLVSEPAALFPVAFAPGNDSLLYVRVSREGSDLFAVSLRTGEQRLVARLADELTRDWTLSPAGDLLAYLALSVAADRVSSRALVLELASGRVTMRGSGDGDDFGPAWAPGGTLTLGRLVPGRGGTVVTAADGEGSALPAPARGFDVPLAWSPDGRELVARTFDGSTAAAPGRSVLTVIKGDGSRATIAASEVTFLGWISP